MDFIELTNIEVKVKLMLTFTRFFIIYSFCLICAI